MTNNLSKKLAIILLALTAIPLSVFLAIAMRIAGFDTPVIGLAASGQCLAQFLVAGILAEAANDRV